MFLRMPSTTRRSGRNERGCNDKQYIKLLKETLPTAIKTEAQNEEYITHIEKITFSEIQARKR